MPAVDVEGQSIFYRRYQGREPGAATRPPLLLIHGAGGTLMNWPPPIRRLGSATVYALDLPGHGDSPGNGLDTIAAYREQVVAFVDVLDLHRFVAVGHSMGGAIALDLAIHESARLAGLVLVGTSARLPVSPRLLDGLRNDFPAAVQWLAPLLFGPNVFPALRDEYQRHMSASEPDMLQDDFRACDHFDVTSQVGDINLPTLILCGEHDRMTPPAQSEALHDQIAGSQLQIIADAGHMVMLEQPHEVADKIGTFLRERVAQGD